MLHNMRPPGYSQHSTHRVVQEAVASETTCAHVTSRGCLMSEAKHAQPESAEKPILLSSHHGVADV